MPSEQGPASSRRSGPVPGESAAFTCLCPQQVVLRALFSAVAIPWKVPWDI